MSQLLTLDEVRDLVRDDVTLAGSITAYADFAGVRRSHVSDVLHGRRRPNAALLKYLGLARVERYEWQAARPPDLKNHRLAAPRGEKPTCQGNADD